jgi:hypothetical protein
MIASIFASFRAQQRHRRPGRDLVEYDVRGVRRDRDEVDTRAGET